MTSWHLKMFKKEASEGRSKDELSQTIHREYALSSTQAKQALVSVETGMDPGHRVPGRLITMKQGRQRRAKRLNISFPNLAPEE